MKTSMLALTLALAAVACIATAQIATPPDLPPGEFAASGYSGAGQQPYISGVETYNGSFAYQQYPGGSQQVIAVKAHEILSLCGYSQTFLWL